MTYPSRAKLAPARVMSELVAPFAVQSRLTGEVYRVRFSHLWVAIPTRRSDTVDCKFLVNGRGVIVGLAHAGYVAFAECSGHQLSDPEAAQIAAAYLRECLEDDGHADRTALYVSPEEVVALADRLGYLHS